MVLPQGWFSLSQVLNMRHHLKPRMFQRAKTSLSCFPPHDARAQAFEVTAFWGGIVGREHPMCCFIWLKWWLMHFTSNSWRGMTSHSCVHPYISWGKLWAKLLVLQVLQYPRSWDKYSVFVAFLIFEITEAAAVLLFCLCVKTPPIYLHAGWNMPCDVPAGILPRCEQRWHVPQLSPASLTTRALNSHPIPWSRMWLRLKPPRVILQLGISPWLLCPSSKYSSRKTFNSAIAFVKTWF